MSFAISKELVQDDQDEKSCNGKLRNSSFVKQTLSEYTLRYTPKNRFNETLGFVRPFFPSLSFAFCLVDRINFWSLVRDSETTKYQKSDSYDSESTVKMKKRATKIRAIKLCFNTFLYWLQKIKCLTEVFGASIEK